MKEELAGTTAICVFMKDKKIYCVSFIVDGKIYHDLGNFNELYFKGNVGDSRSIASVRGRVQSLSYDHKPNNELETKRILAAGGWVEFNRVNGNLALSRALGDFVFKKNENKKAEDQIVTAYPDVDTKDLTSDHEFIILACDGIWDVLSNEEVLEFVRTRIAQQIEPEIVGQKSSFIKCFSSRSIMNFYR